MKNRLKNIFLLIIVLMSTKSFSQETVLDSLYNDSIQFSIELFDSEIFISKSVNLNLRFPNTIGKYKRYYSNGKKIVEGEYSNFGKKNGIWTYYYKDKIVNEHYLNNFLIGPYFEMSYDSIVLVSGQIDTSKVFDNLYTFYSGEWTYRHKNGQIRSTGIYTKDINNSINKENFISYMYSSQSEANTGLNTLKIKDGIWKYFNENGGLVKIEKWNKGILLDADDDTSVED